MSFLIYVLISIAICGQTVTCDYTTKSCYLYFDDVSDLGFTFNHNLGRQRAHQVLHKEGYDFISTYKPKCAPLNHSRVIYEFVQSQCQLIVAASPVFTDAILAAAVKYTNITFALQNAFSAEVTASPQTSKNLVVYGTREYEPWYLAGVAAGKQTKSSQVCFIAAFANVPAVNVQINAFVLGVNGKATVHVITMESWYWPLGDQEAAAASIDILNCDVVAHYSDSAASVVYIASRMSNVFSIHVHTNGIDFFGESVLTSCYSDWGVIYENITRTLIERKGEPFGGVLWFDSVTSAPQLGELSPSVTIAIHDAVEEERRKGVSDLWCRDIYDIAGVLRHSKAKSGCLTDAELRNQNYLVRGAVLHKGPFRTGPDTCPAGTFYRYALASPSSPSSEISVQCNACPPNTYASTARYIACDICQFDVSEGSGSCFQTPASSPTKTNVIILATVLGFVGVVCVSLGLLYIRVVMNRAMRVRSAPRVSPITLVFTDIEGSSALWESVPRAMKDALSKHNDVMRLVLQKHNGYEVKTIGDAFFIVFANALDALKFALEVQIRLMTVTYHQELLQHAKAGVVHWNDDGDEGDTNNNKSIIFQGLRVRIGIHRGDVDVVESFSTPLDYFGPNVNIAARVEGEAFGGQILGTQAFLDSVLPWMMDIDSLSSVAFTGMKELKGIAKPEALYSFLVSGLEERETYFLQSKRRPTAVTLIQAMSSIEQDGSECDNKMDDNPCAPSLFEPSPMKLEEVTQQQQQQLLSVPSNPNSANTTPAVSLRDNTRVYFQLFSRVRKTFPTQGIPTDVLLRSLFPELPLEGNISSSKPLRCTPEWHPLMMSFVEALSVSTGFVVGASILDSVGAFSVRSEDIPLLGALQHNNSGSDQSLLPKRTTFHWKELSKVLVRMNVEFQVILLQKVEAMLVGYAERASKC